MNTRIFRSQFRPLRYSPLQLKQRPRELQCVRQICTASKHGRFGRQKLCNPLQSTAWRRSQPVEEAACSHVRYSSTTSAETPKVLVNDMDNQELVIDFNDGQAVRYPSFWLRDHCLCSECSHPHTHQRQIDTFTIDPSIKVSTADATPSGLEIAWSDSTNHLSLFPWSWLQTHFPFPTPSRAASQARSRRWKHHPPSSTQYPSTPYSAIMSPDSFTGLKSWINQIHTYGLSFIPSTPHTPSATQSLLERLAFIRPTHYGGFWDFTSNPQPIDTAYTNLSLPNHTDNTYFTDPAGLQLFHCLSHTSTATPDIPMSGSGGESTFVDGFAAAAQLYATSPKAYHALSSIPIISTAQGAPEGSFYNTSATALGYPVLNHSLPSSTPTLPPASSSFTPENLAQIRWNNLDRSALTLFPNHAVMKTWYRAAALWADILASPEFEIEVKLRPGEPVIFDNWRVLHGRRGFEGARRVCGGYIGMDDFRARGRVLGLEI